MSEKPILFSGAMVRAILAGTKTQTRRVARFIPLEDGFNLGFSGISTGHLFAGEPSGGHVLYSRRGDGGWEQRTKPIHCPYGPRDRLWVRETWRTEELPDGTDGVRFQADGAFVPIADTAEAADLWVEAERKPSAKSGKWRPSIFLPRWASRLTLAVESVRVERLQDISEEDARAEGCDWHERTVRDSVGDLIVRSYRKGFRELWDSINGKRDPGHIRRRAKHGKPTGRYEAAHPPEPGPYSWEANPWVWVVGFKVAEVRRG